MSKSWEQQAVDEIIAEENATEEDCLNALWSHNWLCPCCGASLEKVTAFDDRWRYQECAACGWQSEMIYE